LQSTTAASIEAYNPKVSTTHGIVDGTELIALDPRRTPM